MSRIDRDATYQRIYALVDSIPAGCVSTYGQIAHEVGLPRHARLVGRALGELPKGTQLPWHRVVNAAGAVATRPGTSMRTQRARLKREGIQFTPRGRIDLKRFRWQPDW